MTESEITRLSRLVMQLSQRLDTLEQSQRQAQLDHSSARVLEFRDQYGNPKVVVGQQPDDGFAISYVPGDKPPKPSLPVTDSEELNGIIFWDGLFDGAVPRPSDVLGVDAHLGSSPTFALEDVDPDLPGEQTGTGIGSLTDRGAISYALGSDTKYVRFVSVTNAGVRSDPTDAVPITSLPVSRIALGAVRAEHIDFNATVNGNTLSLSQSGLLVARGDGSVAFYLQTSDAFVLSTGEYRTNDTGARLVINEGGTDPDSIRGYPDTGTGAAALTAYTPETALAGWLMQAAGTDTDDTTRLMMSPDAGAFHWGVLDSADAKAQFALSDRIARMQAPIVRLVIDEAYTSPSGDRRITFKKVNSAGADIAATVLHFRPPASNAPMLVSDFFDVGLIWGGTGELFVKNPADNAFRPIAASAFNINSDASSKSDIQELPGSALEVITSTPVTIWRRTGDGVDGPRYVGPMADDLPEHLVRRDPHGELLVDLASLVGTSWAAIQELAARLGAVEGTVAKLPPGLTKK